MVLDKGTSERLFSSKLCCRYEFFKNSRKSHLESEKAMSPILLSPHFLSPQFLSPHVGKIYWFFQSNQHPSSTSIPISRNTYQNTIDYRQQTFSVIGSCNYPHVQDTTYSDAVLKVHLDYFKTHISLLRPVLDRRSLIWGESDPRACYSCSPVHPLCEPVIKISSAPWKFSAAS